jgi:hypothetical protein
MNVFATLALSLAVSFLVAPRAWAQGGLIQERRPIPDDPLAGLGEDGGGGRTGKTPARPKAATHCRLAPRAADGDAIGDLRAMLLALRHAPPSLPCSPAQVAQGELRLRIAISGPGKVERIDVLKGDPRLANAIAGRLQHRTCAARPQGGTVGEIILAITSPKRPG